MNNKFTNEHVFYGSLHTYRLIYGFGSLGQVSVINVFKIKIIEYNKT